MTLLTLHSCHASTQHINPIIFVALCHFRLFFFFSFRFFCTDTSSPDNDNNTNNNIPCISLVIPAYNEEERLPIMLDQTLSFLNQYGSDLFTMTQTADQLYSSASIQTQTQTQTQTQSNVASLFELVIVNDGSTDKTAKVIEQYADKINATSSSSSSSSSSPKSTIRLIQMKRNSGKGAAIREGMLKSNANYRLMVDADGATDIQDLLKLMKEMTDLFQTYKTSYSSPSSSSSSSSSSSTTNDNDSNHMSAVIIGSRAHLEESSKAERTKVRTFLMHSFHFFVHHLCSKNVKDTQCGFKLFHKTAALSLFRNLHLKRWAFDIEIITLAEQLNMSISEVGVNWKEVDGSKLDTSKWALATASLGMLRDMVFVRLCYSLGFWKIQK